MGTTHDYETKSLGMSSHSDSEHTLLPMQSIEDSYYPLTAVKKLREITLEPVNRFREKIDIVQLKEKTIGMQTNSFGELFKRDDVAIEVKPKKEVDVKDQGTIDYRTALKTR